jgi:hypothetical protein
MAWMQGEHQVLPAAWNQPGSGTPRGPQTASVVLCRSPAGQLTRRISHLPQQSRSLALHGRIFARRRLLQMLFRPGEVALCGQGSSRIQMRQAEAWL